MMVPQVEDDLGFLAWLSVAVPGSALRYHQGFLAVDTSPPVSKLTPREQSRLRLIAEAAWRASEKNLVHLVQSRLGPDHFEYRAVARPPKTPHPTHHQKRPLEAA
jgi:hypothetical protein